MQLCRQNIEKIRPNTTMLLPQNILLALPETVLQFGTGVLLRGLIDFIIDKANKNNIFNGRIVMIKSTETGADIDFNAQDCLYTVAVRGVAKGKIIQHNHCVAVISRILTAKDNWQEILVAGGENPLLQVVVSNTTELGLVLHKESIFQEMPTSFPGKLLAILFRRYIYFKGDIDKGLVIIPTELLPENGKILSDIILQLATYNQLETDFINWLTNHNYFCNSLVDRIVPGKPAAPIHNEIEMSIGCTDKLLIVAEPYYLWAIETDKEKVKKILSFSTDNPQVIIAPNIEKYRELKLRLLNGSHTFSCGLAYLSGFDTVAEAMSNNNFKSFVTKLMYAEILPVICNKNITKQEGEAFAEVVIDRFSNKFIEHKWLSITVQYAAKMMTRNVLVVKKYIEIFNEVPRNMALGMAAHILFMRCLLRPDGSFCGSCNGKEYIITDAGAVTYFKAWELKEIDLVIDYLFEYAEIYSAINTPDFKLEIKRWLIFLIKYSVKDALNLINLHK